MSYDDWKLANDRKGEHEICRHWCANDHVYLSHDVFDAEGEIPNTCRHADEAVLGPAGDPQCETCAQWVWSVVDAVSDAAAMAAQRKAA